MIPNPATSSIPLVLPCERNSYQVYANHKQIVAIRSNKKPAGNIRNILDYDKRERHSKTNKTNGRFSNDSQKRLKETIYNWASTIFILKETTDFKKKHKNLAKYINFCFVTLTIPKRQEHSDLELKTALNRFMQKLTRSITYDFNYVWRAETQENGNIHFHLLIDHYFPIWVLCTFWNECLDNLGYLSGLEFINPPTVNLKIVKNLKHVWSYLSKYCSKSSYSNRRGVQGHQWGSSESIKKLEGKFYTPMTTDEWFNIVTKSMQREAKISYINDWVTVIYLCKQNLSDIIGKPRALEWLAIIKDNFAKIEPYLLNYQFNSSYTTNDYQYQHSFKFNYLNHVDDTDITQHYQKYDEVYLFNKKMQYLNKQSTYQLKSLGWRNDKSNAGEQLPTIPPAK